MNDSMPRVLQVVTDTDRRGAQVFAADLHRELARTGVAVRTVALAPGTDPRLDLPTLGPSRRHPRVFASLRRLARRADVVVAHGSTTLPVSVIALAGTSTPIVYRQISDSLFWADDRRRMTQTRWALGRTTRVVALWQGSAAVLTEHFGVPAGKIDVIPNGVPAENFWPASDAERVHARRELGLEPDLTTVAYVGALAQEKGVDRAITALAGRPNVQLLVAGAGREEKALRHLATSVGAQVTFAGSLESALPAYHAADLLTLPSRGGDSMPAVLIEAGLCALPCVTTDVAAIPEIVRNGTSGIVVPHDDDDAVGFALRQATTWDAAKRDDLGSAARAHATATYAIDIVGAQWSATIDTVRRPS